MLKRAASAVMMIATLAIAGCVTPQVVEEPRIALQNVRILKAEGLMQRLQVDLLVSNPNDFDIPLTGLDFTLSINGNSFAQGLSNEQVTIPRLGEATVPVQVTVSLLSVFEQLQTVRKTKSLDYAIGGKIFLDHVILRTVPFDKTGSLTLRSDSQGGILAPI